MRWDSVSISRLDVVDCEAITNQATTATTLTPTKTAKARSKWCVMSSGCRLGALGAIKTSRLVLFWPTQIAEASKHAIVF